MRKIKKVTTYISNIKDDDQEFYISSELEYDENDNVILSVTYDEEGLVSDKTISSYNEKGSIIEEINYVNGDEILEKFSFIRNEDDKVSRVIVEYGEGSKSFKEYIRNPDENSLTIIIKDDDEMLEGKEFYKFNSDNKVIEKILYSDEGKIEQHVKYDFDDRSRVVNQKEFHGKNEVLTETLFYYNDKDNLTKQLTVNRKRELTNSIQMFYDENDNMIEQKIGSAYIIKYQYNSNNLLVKEEKFYSNGLLEEQTEYEYDENNMLVLENNYVTKTKYEYEYFEEISA